MSAMVAQIPGISIAYSVYSGADQENTKVPVIGEFTAQRASNAENVSIWLRHHGATGQDHLHRGTCNVVDPSHPCDVFPLYIFHW